MLAALERGAFLAADAAFGSLIVSKMKSTSLRVIFRINIFESFNILKKLSED